MTFRKGLGALCAFWAGCALQAGIITVPNGNFTSPGNVGSIGAILGSGSSLIGSGP